MHSTLSAIHGSFFKFLCAFMISFAIAIQPAFALPKSPFLGMEEESAPRIQLLQPTSVLSQERDPLFGDSLFIAAPSNIGYASLNTVGLFHDPAGYAALGAIVIAGGVILVLLLTGAIAGGAYALSH